MDPHGQFFFIKSKLSGLVLEIAECRRHPGASVSTWEQMEGEHEHQQWYIDHGTGTIRSRLNDFCLDLDGDRNACVSPYAPDESNQQWELRGPHIFNRDSEEVFDIVDHNSEPGARITSWAENGGDNQMWDFEYIPVKYFFIKSKHCKKVLDIKGWEEDDEPEAGKKIIIYSQKDPAEDNQLWYEDDMGLIRCKLANFTIDSSDASCIRANDFNPNSKEHQWIFSGEVIVNKSNPGLCLDIIKKSRRDKAELCAFEYRNQSNQQWEKEYI